MVGFDRTQKRNGKVILAACMDAARANLAVPPKQASRYGRRLARLAIMCALAEADLYVYASRKVPRSLSLPYDRIGSDHLSVGLFQQQVPMWGPVEVCQNPRASALHFLRALQARFPGGVVTLDWNPNHVYTGPNDPIAGLAIWQQVQRVQGSAFQNLTGPYGYGLNYKAQRLRSGVFVMRYWGRVK